MTNLYRWQGIKNNSIISGNTAAQGVNDLKSQLASQGIELLSQHQALRSHFKRRAPAVQPLPFCQQLQTLLSQGFYLSTALDMMCKTHSNQAQYQHILTEVKSGTTLSEALQNHTDFKPFIISLIKVGESTGKLSMILELCTQFLSTQQALRAEIKKAMLYPSIVFTITLLITLGLLYFVVPQFQNTFSSFGAALPAATQLLINFSNVLHQHALSIAATLAMVCITIIAGLRRCKACQTMLLSLITALPIIKSFRQQLLISQLSRILSISLQAHLPLPLALQQCINTFSHPPLSTELQRALSQINGGSNLSQALSQISVINEPTWQLITIAEAAGNLSPVLEKIAIDQEQQLAHKVKHLNKSLEPLIMVILSVIIGGIVMAMYLPIFQIGNIM